MNNNKIRIARMFVHDIKCYFFYKDQESIYWGVSEFLATLDKAMEEYAKQLDA